MCQLFKGGTDGGPLYNIDDYLNMDNVFIMRHGQNIL